MYLTDYDEVALNREIEPGLLYCVTCSAYRYDEEDDRTCHVCGDFLPPVAL